MGCAVIAVTTDMITKYLSKLRQEEKQPHPEWVCGCFVDVKYIYIYSIYSIYQHSMMLHHHTYSTIATARVCLFVAYTVLYRDIPLCVRDCLMVWGFGGLGELLTFHMILAVLADDACVVQFVRWPLVDVHGRVGGSRIQHNPILRQGERERQIQRGERRLTRREGRRFT